MGKSNGIIVKTFEEFQDDNKQYYPIVLQAITQMTAVVQPGSKQAGDWVIEGDVNYNVFPDTGEDSINDENEISFRNNKLQTDIFINWSLLVEKGRVTPETYTIPGDTEYNTTLNVDSILYYTEDGSNEYQIVVDDQMSKAVEALLDKLQKH